MKPVDPCVAGGDPPVLPLSKCSILQCNCGFVFDGRALVMYEGGRMAAPVRWDDLVNAGWSAGRPPLQAVFGAPKCDCGAAVVHGPGTGHSSWCSAAREVAL